jgi:cellulose synthase/poly-beta-1,6-N-acetylglucosamine synthase-like glycosyltransferase
MAAIEAGGAAENDVPSGAAEGVTVGQKRALAVLLLLVLVGLWLNADLILQVLHALIVTGFVVSACSKLILAGLARGAATCPPLRRDFLPTYSILVPLYREADVVEQLIVALSALDYPRHRLQAILILEADDEETLGALAWLQLPRFVEVLVKPPGGPRTKPNALNAALRIAHGELVVVYDAEDIPHPGQLREAAARFAAEPDLACLQAPLRIGNADAGFLARQFALEYAGQFDAILPGLERLGCTFPLGGTSNHLRASVLNELGGWDAFNVTEDADLGLRLGGPGRRVAMIAAPTREDAPTTFADWLLQRARWVKGYMQTWGVQMRRPLAGGLCKFLTLQVTLGVSIMGAALHAVLMLTLLGWLAVDGLVGAFPPSVWADLSVLSLGWGMAVLANAIGARRAGMRMSLGDALASLAFWPLQSLAFAVAVRQLIVSPYHWDKTPHIPSVSAAATAEGEVDPSLDGRGPWSVSPAA